MILTIEQIAVFGLIMARLAGMLPMSPFLDGREIFSLGKVALIFWMSVIYMFVIPLPTDLPSTPIAYFLAMVTEMLVGYLLAYGVQILVMGFEFAGFMIDNQSALGATNLLDPSSGRSNTVLQKLLEKTISTVFVIVGAHYILISGIFQSFKVIPLGHPFQIAGLADMMISTGADVFFIALQISAPTLIMIFLVDYCLGMVNKIAPQVNVFQFGMMVKPLMSMYLFGMIMPGFINGLEKVLEKISEIFLHMFIIMQP